MSVLNCLGTKASQTPEIRLAILNSKLEEKTKFRNVAEEFLTEKLSKLIKQLQEMEEFKKNSQSVTEKYRALILSVEAIENDIEKPEISNRDEELQELEFLYADMDEVERNIEEISFEIIEKSQILKDLVKENEAAKKQVSDIDHQINKISLKIQMLNQI